MTVARLGVGLVQVHLPSRVWTAMGQGVTPGAVQALESAESEEVAQRQLEHLAETGALVWAAERRS